MNQYYTKFYTIPAEACDDSGRCRLPFLLSCLEEVTFLDSERLGYSGDLIRSKYNGCLMILSNSIRVSGTAMLGQLIEVRTAMCGIRGMAIMRDYQILLDGVELLAASSRWVIVDYTKRTLCSPRSMPELVIEPIQSPVTAPFFRLSPPSAPSVSAHCAVRPEDIDINGHMNNVRYVEIALRHLPAECVQGHFQAAFEYHFELLEAQPYDCLTQIDGNLYSVIFRSDGKDCFRMQISTGC